MRHVLRLVVWGFMVLNMGAPAQALTVRVDPAGGAPRRVVDGKPVRARMFWGARGTRPIPLPAEATLIEREFTAIEGEPAGATMHLRFGQTPGDLFLDDIQVTDLDTGKDVVPPCTFESGPDAFAKEWTFWPTGEQNTVATVAVQKGCGRDGSAGLRVSLKAPAKGSWPDWHLYHLPNLALVKGHRYRVRLWVRAEPARELLLAFYRPGHNFVFLGAPGDCFADQVRLAAGAGVDFVSMPVSIPWPEPGKPVDWSASDSQCEAVLAANPRALLLPRIGVDPPAWWQKAHPDEVMLWEDGAHKRGTAVPASPLYRREACERLGALVAHLEEKFGDRVAGYHPCGQNTGEFFYEDSWGHPLNGYAPADLAAWRVWLKERYRADSALRQAWGDPAAALATAAVPAPAARHAAPAGILRDPVAERPVIEFAEFQQEAMAGLVCELARSVRQASRGRKLVVFFYGYGFEFAAVGTGPASSGHYALRRVLQSPDIDVLCSPISYFDRGLGGYAPAMSAAESVALAGKMWLCEDDTATYLSTGTCPGWREKVKTLAETNTQLVRNVAHEATRNFATWWMDLTASGWFNDPGMWSEMDRLKALDQTLLEAPTPYRPQIAAVLDERSMPRVAQGGTLVTRPGIYEVRAPLGRMGAPYGQYLLDDVLAGRVGAKVYVFLNAWSLSAAERAQLLKATRGALRVWCYAPGYHDGSRVSTEAMRELTGFRLERATPEKAWATPGEAGRKRGLENGFGVEKKVEPLFAAADAAPAETLATYPDGRPAVALRRSAEGTSLFVGAPGLTAELLRLAAREAGVHLFTETDCNVYANGSVVAVHASHDGPVTLNTGKPGPITDMLTGEKAGAGPRLVLPLKKGDTRVLRY